MAFDGVTVELELDGVWTDITAYVYAREGIQINRGRANEQSSPSPAQCELTLDNRDGRFSPRNPTGPYYGAIGRNTPLRVTTDAGSSPSVRFIGEVASWPVGWDHSENAVWVGITANGIRRRLSQGQTPLRGPLDRATRALTGLGGYWPMNDPDGSTQFANAAAGNALTVGGSVEYAANETAFPSIDPLPTFQGGSATAPVSGIAAGTVQMRALVFVPSGLGGLIHSLMQVRYASGSVGYADLSLLANTGNIALSLYDAAGAFIAGATTGTVDDIRDRPVTLVMTVAQNGANVDLTLDVVNAAGTITTYTDSAASLTLGVPDQVTIGSSVVSLRVPPVNITIGQLSIAGAASAADALQGGLTGFNGETAGDRIERLGIEEDVLTSVVGDASTSARMGPQQAGAFLDLLEEAAEADGGLLTEDHAAGMRLVYLTRDELYDQDDALTLNYAARQIEALEPTEDDQAIVNDLTVSRVGGSSARYELTTGPLSTADPPDGVGRYDSAIELSLYSDDQLADQAAWRVAVGTIDEARYPVIGVNLFAPAIAQSPGTVVDDILGITEGRLLVVTSPPTFAGTPDNIRVHVAGWTETITPSSYQFTFVGIPASPYDDVGVYDDDGPSYYLTEERGTRYSGGADAATTEALDTTETGVDFTDPAGDWSDADAPFDINIGGERMTVSAISGSGAQTFTVTRSVNGVVKSHPSGSPVSLWQPARYAL